MQRHTNIVAAYLILQKENRVLLLQRQNTGYHDGNYSLVAGHVETGETFTECIIREGKEEAGIRLSAADLTVAHVMHRKSKTDSSERVDVFFTTKQWTGKIKNMEPEKCAQLKWFDNNALPINIIPCVRQALTNINLGILYSEFGWI